MRELTEDVFLTDVANHKMTVLLDNGIYRSVRFAREDRPWYNYFTITTWPSYLCINGDMGCFVFTRLVDMFEFFRTAPERLEDRKLYINPQYWAEKCEAADKRTGGIDEYDEKRFRECVKRDFDEHWRDRKRSGKVECWRRVREEVLCAENEYEAHDLARSFEHEGFEFTDFWEHHLRSYTFQFLWCCYAITWAIQQYDKEKQGTSS